MHVKHMLFIAGAMSVLLAGCGKPDETAVPVASTSLGTQIDDTVLTTMVKSALLADPDIKSFDLKVESRKGVVQLSGFVDSQAQVDGAIMAVRAVQGVASVENAITIKEGAASVGQAVDDGIITTKVKSALLADPGIRSLDLNVKTFRGTVQLSGFVESQAQVDLALAIAGKVDGVTGVGNELSIKN